MTDKKREEPEPVEPLVLDGVRYEAPLMGGDVGAPQDGGVLAAYDDATGRLLWTLVVYTHDNPDGDEDPEVYIRSITPAGDGRSLCVINEHGQEFRVDLETRTVTPITVRKD